MQQDEQSKSYHMLIDIIVIQGCFFICFQNQLGVSRDRDWKIYNGQRLRWQTVPMVRCQAWGHHHLRSQHTSVCHRSHEWQLLPSGDLVYPWWEVQPCCTPHTCIQKAAVLLISCCKRSCQWQASCAEDYNMVDGVPDQSESAGAAWEASLGQWWARTQATTHPRWQPHCLGATGSLATKCQQLAGTGLAAEGRPSKGCRGPRSEHGEHGEVLADDSGPGVASWPSGARQWRSCHRSWKQHCDFSIYYVCPLFYYWIACYFIRLTPQAVLFCKLGLLFNLKKKQVVTAISWTDRTFSRQTLKSLILCHKHFS